MSRVTPFTKEDHFCPVCKMKAVQDDLWRTHLGIKHFFCSQQCVDRFIALSGLYTGHPKTGPAEKQKGRIQIKRHKISFSEPISAQSMAEIQEAVRVMMGVKSLNAHREAIFVTYDLMEVSLEDIEKTVERILGKIDSPMIEHVKRGWIHYTEECELENLAHPSRDGGCH